MFSVILNIIPYVVTWDGIVTKYHGKYIKRLGIRPEVEAYTQSIVFKKTVETISFDKRRGIEEGLDINRGWEATIERVKVLADAYGTEDNENIVSNRKRINGAEGMVQDELSKAEEAAESR